MLMPRCSKVLLVILLAMLVGCAAAPPPKPQRSEQEQAQLEAAYAQAMSATRSGADQHAEQQWYALISRFPDFAGSYFNLAALRQRQGRCEDALQMLEQGLALDGGNAVAYNIRGVCLRQLERYREAEKAYLRALDIDRSYANAHLNLAMLYEIYFQQLEFALKHYKRYRRLSNDEQADAWIADIEFRLESR